LAYAGSLDMNPMAVVRTPFREGAPVLSARIDVIG
jgi:hypothetical protein